jgi:hypothetical protein
MNSGQSDTRTASRTSAVAGSPGTRDLPAAGRPLRGGMLTARVGGWLRAHGVLAVLAVIVLLGLALRVYFLFQYRPALLGYPDSANYINAARTGVFQDPARVAGYVLFLRLLHLIYPHLEFVAAVQHLLGIASGLLLFDAVRRAGVARWVGLVPAVIVMLGGLELMLEHAILTDPLFIFLVDLSIWFCVRAWTGSRRWALLTGLSLGCAMIDRTEGVVVFPVLLICLMIAPGGVVARRHSVSRTSEEGRLGWRQPFRERPVAAWRLGAALLCLAGCLLIVVPFLYEHDRKTGSWNFTSSGDIALYGRVAPWANCQRFTPPAGTRDLCISQPVSKRLGSNAWQYDTLSPAVKVFGDDRAVPGENAKLKAFAEAAILGQPLDYLHYVVRDLARAVDPNFPTSPYPAIGDRGYGTEDAATVDEMLDRARTLGVIRSFVNKYYSPVELDAGNVSFLRSWDHSTRIVGPVMILLVVLALASPFVATGLPRRMAILCLGSAAAIIIGPVLLLEWSARYEVPGLGPLGAAAGIALWAVYKRLSDRTHRSAGSAG